MVDGGGVAAADSRDGAVERLEEVQQVEQSAAMVDGAAAAAVGMIAVDDADDG